MPSGLSCVVHIWLLCHKGYHLHTGSLELCQNDHRVLGHLSYEGPSHLIAQFGQVASSRKSPVPNFFYLRIMEDTVLLGTLYAAELFFLAFPRSVPRHNPVSEHCSHCLVWYTFSDVRPYTDRCVPFQIMCNQFNLTQVDSKIECVIAKGLNQWWLLARIFGETSPPSSLVKMKLLLFPCFTCWPRPFWGDKNWPNHTDSYRQHVEHVLISMVLPFKLNCLLSKDQHKKDCNGK